MFTSMFRQIIHETKFTEPDDISTSKCNVINLCLKADSSSDGKEFPWFWRNRMCVTMVTIFTAWTYPESVRSISPSNPKIHYDAALWFTSGSSMWSTPFRLKVCMYLSSQIFLPNRALLQNNSKHMAGKFLFF